MSGYMRGTPPGSLGLFHDSGWMTEQNFDLWMEHFIAYTKPSKEIPVLLLMGKQPEPSICQSNKPSKSGVVLMTFPPHTTNKLQPLDVSVYGPLKTFYNNACNNWQLTNPGKTIGLYDIGQLSAQAITRALNPENILSGYKRTGIQPFDENIFKDDEFLPSYISDRPDPQLTIVTEPTNHPALPKCYPFHSYSSESVAEMHRHFVEQHPDSVKYWTYKDIIDHDNNISFGFPGSDICDTCEKFITDIKAADLAKESTQAAELKAQHELHVRKADVFTVQINEAAEAGRFSM